MIDRIRGGVPAALCVLAVAALAVAAPAAVAAPVSVTVRVEGTARTIFDGPVTTDGHAMETASSNGRQTCDGTNAGAHPSPVPVATAALDDAARLNNFTWDGTYGNFGIDDFFVTRVDDETADPNSEFWSLYVNRKAADVGGCQKRVAAGDEVLWARTSFAGPPAVPLELRGPSAARTDEPVNVTVVDGESGAAQAGATVNGAPTGPDGVATLTFADEGVYRLKAEKPGAVRSNAITLCVDPLGADPCTSADRTAPSLAVRLPGERLASERGRSRTMLVSWQADDAAGAGVSHYAVDVRQVAAGVSAGQADPEWRPIVERTTLPGVHYRGASGHGYRFRVTAVDRASNRASVVTAPIFLPVDDRDRGLWRFSRGWKPIRSEAAWGRTVVRAREAGATATLRFEGRSVALIGRKLRNGGRLRVTVDGRSRAVRLSGRSPHRRVLWTSRRLREGGHVLRVRSLGGGPVELDAVAPQP